MFVSIESSYQNMLLDTFLITLKSKSKWFDRFTMVNFRKIVKLAIYPFCRLKISKVSEGLLVVSQSYDSSELLFRVVDFGDFIDLEVVGLLENPDKNH